MRSFREIKSHYQFTDEDEGRLASLGALMAENAGRAMDLLHAWMLETKETGQFFADEASRKRVFDSHRVWFRELFSGKYDSRYYESLIRIGQIHVKVSVSAHFVNRAFNLLRTYCIEVLSANIDDAQERLRALISVEKIFDMNLDVITSSYI